MNVIGLMREYGRQNIVFSSSCTVYGEPEKQPVTEQTPRKPATSPYGNTKQMCEFFPGLPRPTIIFGRMMGEVMN